MKTNPRTLWIAVCAVGMLACHADADDPAGQAGELADPVRRPNAIANIKRLYTNALAAAEGDRSAAPVRAVADVTAEKLAQAYLDYPDDSTSGAEIMSIFEEMRDTRSLPAVIKALDWRPGTEQHAISAARIVRWVEIPDAQRGEAIDALGAALSKVRQSRAEDNRLRREVILALGALGDARAAPHLTAIVERQADDQNFLFNRLAARELARVATADTVPVYIRGLFMYDPSRPQVRLEDVARSGLVRIGEPAIEPLLTLFRGENEELRPLVDAFVNAVREQTETDLTSDVLMKTAAAATLGAIGSPRSFQPLLSAARSDSVPQAVRWEAAVALVQLNLDPQQLARVRDTLRTLYGEVELERKPRILAAMRQTYDPSYLEFFLAQARDTDTNPDLRITAVRAYAQLSNKRESAALRAVIRAEPAGEDGGFRHLFEEQNGALDAADECDEDVSCWTTKLGESDAKIVIKASYMLGRLARGNEAATTALVEKLSHPDPQVRFAAINAIDHIAVDGSEEAVAKIDELAEREEGQSIWNQFSAQALPIQSRLRNRGG